MEAVYLDTHVVAWLYGTPAELSRAATDAIRGADELRVSPIVRLELQYLYEIGRASEPAASVIDDLGMRVSLKVCPAPFELVISEAERQSWTRDPFDRVIVAQAAMHDALLITRDRSIRMNYRRSFW